MPLPQNDAHQKNSEQDHLRARRWAASGSTSPPPCPTNRDRAVAHVTIRPLPSRPLPSSRAVDCAGPSTPCPRCGTPAAFAAISATMIITMGVAMVKETKPRRLISSAKLRAIHAAREPPVHPEKFNPRRPEAKEDDHHHDHHAEAELKSGCLHPPSLQPSLAFG